jgi:hypothetical protein
MTSAVVVCSHTRTQSCRGINRENNGLTSSSGDMRKSIANHACSHRTRPIHCCKINLVLPRCTSIFMVEFIGYGSKADSFFLPYFTLVFESVRPNHRQRSPRGFVHCHPIMSSRKIAPVARPAASAPSAPSAALPVVTPVVMAITIPPNIDELSASVGAGDASAVAKPASDAPAPPGPMRWTVAAKAAAAKKVQPVPPCCILLSRAAFFAPWLHMRVCMTCLFPLLFSFRAQLADALEHTVIVQFGSHTTRFARAFDKVPHTMPTIVAYKLTNPATNPTSGASAKSTRSSGAGVAPPLPASLIYPSSLSRPFPNIVVKPEVC